jgi:hypothetical protein
MLKKQKGKISTSKKPRKTSGLIANHKESLQEITHYQLKKGLSHLSKNPKEIFL